MGVSWKWLLGTLEMREGGGGVFGKDMVQRVALPGGALREGEGTRYLMETCSRT